jgi:hypothetical protein
MRERQLAPHFQTNGEHHAFGNAAVALRWNVADSRLSHVCIVDREHSRTLEVDAPFSIAFADGRVLGIGDLSIVDTFREEALSANVHASREADHHEGKRVTAVMTDAQQRLRIEWRVEQRENARYLRMHLVVTALTQDEPVTSVSLFTINARPNARHSARRIGELDAVPVVDGNVYLGFELPLASSETGGVTGATVTFRVARELPLEKGKSFDYSAVAGVFRDGQLRRDFASYLERERAHPYRSFLHYNSWYDIGFLTAYTQDQALERIHAIGRELHEKRGVQLDSFLFDDGWDDYSGSWQFSAAFPGGFMPLREAAATYGAAPGVWLSPWGGYGPPRAERVERGRAAGYETIGDGLALSGPKYYQRFHEAVLNLLTRDGVNHFKLDGTGNADTVVPHSRFNSDWDAAIDLIEAMRDARQDVFINLSTGTVASPFWLRHVDSIWRNGADYGFAGKGSDREQWITYRDAQTYRNVVCASPLFPLNSLMLHGIIYAQENKRLNTDPTRSFSNEVRSYFGSGTQLQELYVTPSLLDELDWDVLAECARWARANAHVLRDCHWIGGAPEALEPYGWAAWTPSRAIVTLRNPGDSASEFLLDLGKHLELPDDATTQFSATSPFLDSNVSFPELWDAARPHALQLGPFEVLTLEFTPVT